MRTPRSCSCRWGRMRVKLILIFVLALTLGCSTPQQRQNWKDAGEILLVASIIGGLVVLAIAADRECRKSGAYCGGSTYQAPATESCVQQIHTISGTCSWHGGVVRGGACIAGYAYCADGKQSPGRQRCMCHCPPGMGPTLNTQYCTGPLYRDIILR